MPVFLTKNVSTELGLTNGTTGIIRQIALQSSERMEDTLGVQALSYVPQYVVLECNDLLMNPLNGLLPNHVPIFPVDGVFSIRKTATHERLTISRKQFPLEPAFCCTAHKSQGQTLRKVIVDLVPARGMKKTDISFVYVPLSRVRSLKDVTILRPFDS